jgi:hypothetical protein
VTADASARRAHAVDVTLLFLGLVALWVIPHHAGADGEVRLQALGRLMKEGDLSVPRYSIVGPLFAAPLYLVGQAELLNVTLFTIALALLWRELRDRTLLVLLVFASMFPNHVQVFYGEPFTALAVTLGIVWLSRGKRALGWSSIVLGGVNTPASVVGIGAVALLEARRTRSLRPLAAPAATLALACLENLVTRGGLLRTGYEGATGFKSVMPYSGGPGFNYPLFFGLLAIVLSFGKGLLFFTPGLFAPLASDAEDRTRHMHRMLVAFVIGLVLIYAKWWAWYGGTFWGPRFFLVASVPACLVLASHLRSSAPRRPLPNALLALGLALSFWVGVNGLVFDITGLGVCTRDQYAYADLCHFTPDFSPLWHPLWDFRASVPEKTRPLAIGVCIFWAGACGWIGRSVFAQMLRDGRAALASLAAR